MTATTVKSTALTTAQGNGLVSFGASGVLKCIDDSYSVLTTSIDEIGDKILFVPIDPRAIPKSIKLFNTDCDTNGAPALAVDVGLYHGEGTGTADGTVIDADLFASAITTLQSANLVGVEVLHESGIVTLTDTKKALWELGGLTACPDGHLAIGIAVTTAAATAAAGTVRVLVEYI